MAGVMMPIDYHSIRKKKYGTVIFFNKLLVTDINPKNKYVYKTGFRIGNTILRIKRR